MKTAEIETMKPVIPYNLQMFADDGDSGDGADSNPDNKGDDGNNKTDPEPTQSDKDKLNEALAQLAKEKAAREKAESDSERHKKALDKEMSKNKQLTSDLRSKMTVDEQKKADEEQAILELKERAEAAERKANRYEAERAYKSIIDDEETLDTLLDAINDADHTTIAKIVGNLTSKAVAVKEAEWKKSRPPISSGDGSGASMSVDEIMAIKDPAERVRKIAENKELFS